MADFFTHKTFDQATSHITTMKKDTSTAGEAFVESFANVTRSMLAQSKALARTVSLAQVLDIDRSGSEDKENEENRVSEDKQK